MKQFLHTRNNVGSWRKERESKRKLREGEERESDAEEKDKHCVFGIMT